MSQTMLLEQEAPTVENMPKRKSPPESKPARSAARPARATAETMAAKQRDISVSEFFAKNRHLLGFDNPRKALLTTVKEAVDNSLDACEEAGILSDLTVVIEDLEEGTKGQRDKGTKGEEKDGTDAKKPRVAQSSRYRVTVIDNGPGIVKKQVEHIFGRLLYGSKFHRLKMSRGQQGIGISAAGMYGLITTGRPMLIQSRPDAKKRAHHIELAMNTKTNRAEVTTDVETDDFPLARLRDLTAGTRELATTGEFLSPGDYPTGTSVSIELEGKYQKGRGSVDEFLELTAIANPHARITFVPPGRFTTEDTESTEGSLDFKKQGAQATPPTESLEARGSEPPTPSSVGSVSSVVQTLDRNGIIVFPRAVTELPPETKEIQPHPRGVELGTLLQMLKETEQERGPQSLYTFLQERFCRVSAATASALCDKVDVTSRTKVGDLDHAQAEKLFRELQEAKLPPPPTDCLAPIGLRQLLAGLLKGVRAEFYAASSREPDVYRGRPFLIEAAIAFGGELAADEPARVIRFANRVPLLYQQSACSSFKAVIDTNWRNYDLQQPRGAIPVGPLVIMIHMASVWVPFTSESKEAIADYDEIRKEMKLALMECGRKLGTYLRKRASMKRQGERRDIFERYIGEIAKAVNAINGTDAKKLYEVLLSQARKRTAAADQVLDEEGKILKESPEDQDGVIIVEAAAAPADEPEAPAREAGKGTKARPPRHGGTKGAAADPFAQSKAEAAMLKVAAMGNAGDDAPALLDVAPVKRLNQKGKPPRNPRFPATQAKKTPQRADARQPAASPSRSTRGPRPPAAPASPLVMAGSSTIATLGQTSPASAPAAPKAAKPKMRLVNGKLVPIEDGPGLF